MLSPRIIPCLLIHNNGLVKTVQFKDAKYVGDPINAVKIFNEKEVDEIVVLDIDASVNNREPDYALIEKLALECRMPLCYGGGIKNTEQASRIFSLGVEKVAISSAAVQNPSLIKELAESVGNQSVVVVLDVRKKQFSSKYEVYIHNGKHPTGKEVTMLAKELESFGVGEFVLNDIDNDGKMQGYNWDLIRIIRDVIDVPMTVFGGAGTYDHLKELISNHGIIGAGAGSLFVFKGKFRAVLINYPSIEEKKKIFQNIQKQQ